MRPLSNAEIMRKLLDDFENRDGTEAEPMLFSVGFEKKQRLVESVELDEFKNFLRSAPTEYFEAKPKKVVGLSDFGGAIVPKGTRQSVLDNLKRAGVRTEIYNDEAGRLSARGKFKEHLFQAAPIVPAVGLLQAGEEEDNPFKM